MLFRSNIAWGLNSYGSIYRYYCSDSVGSRPVFTLPSTFTATYYVDSEGNTHDQQEYETAGSTTDVQGNPITIGTQIATGSYVGTGTYGASNPNTLTFDFEPKLLFVATKGGGDYGFYVYGQTNFLTFAFSQDTPAAGKCVVNISGNTFTWYVNVWNKDAHGQLNYTTDYNYWAIG